MCPSTPQPIQMHGHGHPDPPGSRNSPRHLVLNPNIVGRQNDRLSPGRRAGFDLNLYQHISCWQVGVSKSSSCVVLDRLLGVRREDVNGATSKLTNPSRLNRRKPTPSRMSAKLRPSTRSVMSPIFRALISSFVSTYFVEVLGPIIMIPSDLKILTRFFSSMSSDDWALSLETSPVGAPENLRMMMGSKSLRSSGPLMTSSALSGFGVPVGAVGSSLSQLLMTMTEFVPSRPSSAVVPSMTPFRSVSPSGVDGQAERNPSRHPVVAVAI